MTLQPGEVLDRYAVEALLGDGEMAKIYRAVDTRLRRTVALKVFDRAGNAEAVAVALREARAAAAICHPNVATVFDVDQVGEVSFIVMEHVAGVSLRRLVGDVTVPVARRLRWLVEIARALAAAHEVRVIHRDVRPENVIIPLEGPVKVLDFGTARRPREEMAAPSDGGDLLTPSSGNELTGSPDYFAPERIRGQKIDGHADQFSWGVVAYELLAGAPPWRRSPAPFVVLSSVLLDEPAPLAPELEVPPEVFAAVMRALAKRPEDRFPSMTDAADALEPFAAAPIGIAAGVPSRRQPSFPTLADPPAIPPSPPSAPVTQRAPMTQPASTPRARLPSAPSLAGPTAPEAPRSTGAFEILERRGGHIYVACGNVLVNIWQRQVAAGDIEASSAAGREMSRRHPAGIGAMNIAHANTTAPGPAARAAGTAALVEAQRWLLATAVVLEGEGFTGSAARAAYAMIQLTVRHQRPQAVFGGVEAAARWIAPKCQLVGTPEELAAAIAEARALVV
jgi:serine/threonine-protein kinase